MPRALIIGGSRGIGAATSSHLAGAGWVVSDLSRTSGCDVSKRDDLAEALNTQPQTDALVYSAGHVDPKPLLDDGLAEWDYHLEVNLTAPVRCAQWFAARGRPGAVVLIASTAAMRPSPMWGPYAAAKAGLVNFGLTAAVEWAHLGVRVYVVAPGRCATHLRAKLAPREDPSSIMQPSEVASVIASLIDDEAGVLAGSVHEIARRS